MCITGSSGELSLSDHIAGAVASENPIQLCNHAAIMF
jgi:hypothetical protein